MWWPLKGIEHLPGIISAGKSVNEGNHWPQLPVFFLFVCLSVSTCQIFTPQNTGTCCGFLFKFITSAQSVLMNLTIKKMKINARLIVDKMGSECSM